MTSERRSPFPPLNFSIPRQAAIFFAVFQHDKPADLLIDFRMCRIRLFKRPPAPPYLDLLPLSADKTYISLRFDQLFLPIYESNPDLCLLLQENRSEIQSTRKNFTSVSSSSLFSFFALSAFAFTSSSTFSVCFCVSSCFCPPSS